jgi:Glycosyl-hydrolase 97 N-terminal
MTNLHKLLFYGALVVGVSVYCPTQALAQSGNGIETHAAVLHHSKAAAGDTNKILIKSPDGSVEAEIYQDPSEGLTYRVLWSGKVVGGPAHIGLRVTNASGDSTREIGLHPHFGVALRGSIDEQYSFRGAKDIAINKANTLSIPTREIDGTLYSVEARAYDNGFAWRVLLPSAATPLNVLEETSTWVLPKGEFNSRSDVGEAPRVVSILFYCFVLSRMRRRANPFLERLISGQRLHCTGFGPVRCTARQRLPPFSGTWCATRWRMASM